MAWWIFQNVVIAGLMAGLVAVACRMGRIGPVGRHALWLIVLVKLVTPPLVVLQWPWPTPVLPLELASRLLDATTPASEAPESHAMAADASAPPADEPPRLSDRQVSTTKLSGAALPSVQASSGSTSGDVATRISGDSWSSSAYRLLVPLLRSALAHSTGVWLIGGLAFALIQCIRIGRVVRRLRAARPADRSLSEQVETVARRLRVHPVRTRVLAGIASPLIWCVNPLRPLLLWPAELPPNMSEACRHGLIIHELAHVRRRDHWVGWLELAAGCAWWWNPLFWYVRSQLRENAELACDGWVISELPDSALTRCNRAAADQKLRPRGPGRVACR